MGMPGTAKRHHANQVRAIVIHSSILAFVHMSQIFNIWQMVTTLLPFVFRMLSWSCKQKIRPNFACVAHAILLYFFFLPPPPLSSCRISPFRVSLASHLYLHVLNRCLYGSQHGTSSGRQHGRRKGHRQRVANGGACGLTRFMRPVAKKTKVHAKREGWERGLTQRLRHMHQSTFPGRGLAVCTKPVQLFSGAESRLVRRRR